MASWIYERLNQITKLRFYSRHSQFVTLFFITSNVFPMDVIRFCGLSVLHLSTEREGSPEILPPPQRTSVSKSKSAGDSPTPSTPSVPNASPGTLVPESEANIPVAPEEPLSPPLIFTAKPLQARLDQIFVQQKGKRQSKKGRPAKAKKTVENTNQDEAPVADEKPSIAHIPLPEEEERVALGSPMSEDATLFGEPEEVGTESKPEIKVAAPVSSVEISDDDGSLEAFISECDNEGIN